MAFRRRDGIWLALMAVVVVWGGHLFNYVDAAADDIYDTVSETADDRFQVETAVLRYYVEEIDPVKLQLAQIDGIIEELDTFSDYLNEREQEDLRITLEGGFGGLGIEINTVDHYPTVIAPLEDTPAWEAGLLAGDQIVEIEGETTRDVNLNIIVGKLRGVPGTDVNIKVRRRGMSQTMPFTITRARIVVHSVKFSGFVWDEASPDPVVGEAPDWLRSGEGVGYIRLANFHRGATEDVRDGLQRMTRRGVRGVVIDLRSNPGGLLEEARGVADLFLHKGQLIVSSRGRDPRTEHQLFSRNDPVLPTDVPVVVLVDQYSASASEIVAGAIQDNDRGLIMGDNTYGKGSVQTVYNARFGSRYGLDFSADAELKLTTAYYYSPSGRCIHRPNWREGRRGAVVSKSDADTATIYHTREGRAVRGGGGIAPDVAVENRFERSTFGLIPPRVLFHDYAFRYTADHTDLRPESFVVTDEMIAEFQEFISDTSRHFTPELQGESELDRFEKAISDADYDDVVAEKLEELRRALDAQEDDQFDLIEPFLRNRILTSVADKEWGRDAATRAGFYNDDGLRTALSYINDETRYEAQLAESPPAPEPRHR